ncbi:hypothetical protein C9374_005077 [Naegleria lovaniensis]|uniref:EF-hand domain-containing protein n=1 Tax=Naegleria lovaniensis TaxID=51637 RepID=A0AA88GQ86_NAELO|nr:uncharacterized protein C9374_005077 [Naegleria lovaniensis]KAG2382497.1 hypothetical protein C9374_005077 [Naegleria lovaniensis]
MSDFDSERLGTLFNKYLKQGKEEIETSVVSDLLKEYDRKKFANITLKDVQNSIDIDKYGYVGFSSVENFARNFFMNESSTAIPEIISLFYNNYSSDKGKRFDNRTDRLIEQEDMSKLLIQLYPDLTQDDAEELSQQLFSANTSMCSVKKLAEKLTKF